MCRLPLLVIGVGNEYRRDDSAGLLVARRLRGLLPDDVAVCEASGEASRLMDLWAEADTVILIDAVSSGMPAGTIHRFDAHADPIPTRYFACSSTHAFGVAQAIELGRRLGCLPRRLIVYGIEGHDFGMGAGLSAATSRAVSRVARRVRADVTDLLRSRPNLHDHCHPSY